MREMSTVVKNQVAIDTTKHSSYSSQKKYEKSEPVDFNRMALDFQKDLLAKTAKARGPRA